MILIALAILAADPANLSGVLAAARPGDTVHLADGRYGTVTVKARIFNPPLTIDAGTATVGGVLIANTTGLRRTGGMLTGDPNNGSATKYGIWAIVSNGITVDGAHISGFRVGIVFDRVNSGAITGNWLSQMTTDGMDLTANHSITVAHNACSEFAPAAGAHPDCIQLWSRSDTPPTADIAITANSIVGSMQGISLFDGLIYGVAPGGFDRVSITGNSVLNTYPDGITVYDCRSCTVKNNSVGSLPNYINKAQLYISGGSVVQCGNDVALVPRQSTPPCTN